MLPTGWPLVFGSLLAGGTSIALAAAAYRKRSEPGAVPFAWMMIGNAIWGLSYAAALVTFDPGLRLLFEIPIEIAQAIVAPAWLLFALAYTGRGEYVSRKLVAALLVVPAITLGLVATSTAHSLLWANYRIVETFGAATVRFDPQPWFYVHSLYGYLLIGTGIVLIAAMFIEHGTLYRDQAVALAVGSILPTITHVAYTFQAGPYPAVNATPLALAVTGVTFGYALFRFDLLGLVPATRTLGRQAAIDDVGVVVAIVDDDERVLELNRTAEETFDTTAGEAQGQQLTAVAGDVDLGTEPTLHELATASGRRTFEVSTQPVTDQHDRPIGRTVVFHDVTERERRRQQLEVLNRVLRHNLRNDMGVVHGYAEILVDTLEGEPQRMADAIERRSAALADLGEKARTVETLLEGEPLRTLSTAALTRRIVDDLREAYPDGEVVVDVERDVTGEFPEGTLAAAIENLVENALEHHDGEGTERPDGAPWVHVTVDCEGAGADETDAARERDAGGDREEGAIEPSEVVVTVADDGPGVPEHEIEAIEAGRETALEHGSGLGLWIVHWAAASVGGDVSFADREPRGTVATLRFPVDVAWESDDTRAGSGQGS
ncbi:histidine kinase N-terminal 7TM domain-containing protein [Haloparvum sp. PAK95]|uniref:histidine kinase N-terminal 7TM domain-containing protein n=1 Tax=Haloparvum sp. PAK95 TaxID=3418962 RepID=UPI003D2EF9CD